MLTKRKVEKALIAATAAFLFLVCSGESNARACSELVFNHGIVLGGPVTSFFFWPPTRSDASALVYGWAGILNDRHFYDRVNEYGVTGGTPGIVVPTVPGYSYPTGPLDETTIQAALYYALVNANHVPGNNEVFLIFLPNGTYAKTDGTTQGAHHWYFSSWFPDGNTHAFIYGVIEYMSNANKTNYFVSHELYELFTDPFWNLDSNGKFYGYGVWDESTDRWSRGNAREIADMCQNGLGGTPSWSGYGTTMSQVWSQNLCTCH